MVTTLLWVLASCSTHYISGNATITLAPADVQRHIEAANRGSGESALRLGLHYGYARDDPTKELYWLRRAATLGHVKAQCYLGVLLRLHPEMGEPTEARIWLLKAARSGNEQAKEELQALDRDGEQP